MSQDTFDQENYLQQITGIYLLLTGGKALQNIDTPSFMRRINLKHLPFLIPTTPPHLAKSLFPVIFKNSRIAA